jgi:uncharacterized UPF0160 family protein
MKKLITHGNGFHADDVTAYAILKEVLTKQGETWSLQRSRDPEIIATGDIVFDIGDIYDPATNRYDHHQRGKAGAREMEFIMPLQDLCGNILEWSFVQMKQFGHKSTGRSFANLML